MEKERQVNGDVEIDLMEVFQILLSKWLYIVIFGLVVAILVGVGTRVFITKKYASAISLYVYTNPKGTEAGTITSSDLSAADNLIKTYQVIVKSNTVLDVVAQRLNADHPEYVNFNITAGTLNRMTSVTVPTGTKLLQIRVETVQPQLSADIANTFARYVPDEIVRITKAGGVEIVDYATVPRNPSSPNLTRNVAVGLLIGLVTAAVFFVLRALLDTTIYTSEEIAKVTNCPVIGTVPNIAIGSEAVTPWETSVKEEITHGN